MPVESVVATVIVCVPVGVPGVVGVPALFGDGLEWPQARSESNPLIRKRMTMAG